MSELVWAFYRSVGPASGTGTVAHYHDQMSQSLWLLSGDIATRIAAVPNGHWHDASPEDMKTAASGAYDLLAFDHPASGTLYGIAAEGNTLRLLRYVYAADVSDILHSCEQKEQADNAIALLSGKLQNVDYGLFTSQYTLFNPGAKVTLAFTAGSSEPYPVMTGYLDEIIADRDEALIPFSARNTVGWLLHDQCFDEALSVTGTADEVMARIFKLAGINKYAVQPGDHVWTHSFEPGQTLLSGIEQLFAFYPGWSMVELPDGRIVTGYPTSDLFRSYYENGVYEFSAHSGFMRREISKLADAAYTHVYVSGETASDEDEPLSPVYLPVPNFTGWALGRRKTYHAKAPKGMSQEQLDAYATDLAQRLKYVGITESFDGPLKPYILVGDVGDLRMSDLDSAIRLGIITGVTNSFSRDRGFMTSFTLDSGGDSSDTSSTRVTSLGGYNRRQSIIDFISNLSGRAKGAR
jgi:hypothetical protein